MPLSLPTWPALSVIMPGDDGIPEAFFFTAKPRISYLGSPGLGMSYRFRYFFFGSTFRR